MHIPLGEELPVLFDKLSGFGIVFLKQRMPLRHQ